MSILTRPLTYDDLVQVPEDGNRYEIIGGELVVAPAPIPLHQRVSKRAFLLLDGFVETRGLGEVFYAPLDVQLGDHDIVEPDLVFIARERLAIVERTRVIGVPDLLVEILSPLTRIRDEALKARLYAEAGVAEYWIVDPDERTLRVFVLEDERYALLPPEPNGVHSRVLPGLVVDVAALFEDLA